MMKMLSRRPLKNYITYSCFDPPPVFLLSKEIGILILIYSLLKTRCLFVLLKVVSIFVILHRGGAFRNSIQVLPGSCMQAGGINVAEIRDTMPR